jgi:hypothetical protein
VKSEPKSQKGEPKPLPERRGKPVSQRLKKRKISDSDSESSINSYSHHETFQKRDRHKTREDRYEPKKRKHRSGTHDEARKWKKKREKRGDKTKASKKAAEDLMTNFSSKSVSQERLTVGNSSLHCLAKADSARFVPSTGLVYSEMAAHPLQLGDGAVCITLPRLQRVGY